MKTRQGTDTPVVGSVDTLKIKVVEHPFSFRDSPDEHLTALIVTAINHMGGVGEHAEEAYQRALAALRDHVDAVVKTVAAEYSRVPENQYLDRWSLVQLFAELPHPSALATLERILASDIPPERSKDPHGHSTVGEEVMIRTTAVDALARLHAAKIVEAGRILLRYAEHPTFSIRRACVQAVMETGSPDEQKNLQKILQKRGETSLLEIRRRDVREVPQATGGRFIVRDDRKNEPPSPGLKGRPAI